MILTYDEYLNTDLVSIILKKKQDNLTACGLARRGIDFIPNQPWLRSASNFNWNLLDKVYSWYQEVKPNDINRTTARRLQFDMDTEFNAVAAIRMLEWVRDHGNPCEDERWLSWTRSMNESY